MIDSNLKILEDLGFKNIGDSWVGKYKEYLFKIFDYNRLDKKIKIIFSIYSAESKGNFIHELDNLQKQKVIQEYSLDNDSFEIIYHEENLKYSFIDFLNSVTEKLKEINARNKCDNCGDNSNIECYCNQTATSFLCDTCFAEASQSIKNVASSPNNYVLGLIGSLIGAVIGSILWIIIGALGFYASIAGFAIAYMSFKGYEIVKAKTTTVGIILNIISVIVALLFAQYIGIFIELLKEYPTLTISDFITVSPHLFTDSDFIVSLLPNLGLGLLFAILGSFRTIKDKYLHAAYTEKMQIEKIVL